MNISSISQAVKFNLNRQLKSFSESDEQNRSITNSSVDGNVIRANYNKAGINFKSKNMPLNLVEWINNNNINARTLDSYNKLKMVQKDNVKLMKKINNAIPVLTKTQHTIQYAQDEMVQYVTQYLTLIGKNKVVGEYFVEYGLDGQIIDDSLKTL